MISLHKDGSDKSWDLGRRWKVVSVRYLLEGQWTGLIEMDICEIRKNKGNQRWLLFFRLSFYSLTGVWPIMIRLRVHESKSQSMPPLLIQTHNTFPLLYNAPGALTWPLELSQEVNVASCLFRWKHQTRRGEVIFTVEYPVSMVNKSAKCSTWRQSQKRQKDLCSFPRQTVQYHSNPSLYPNQ